MRIEDLRALQAPLKERYRDKPEAAILTLHAEGALKPELRLGLVQALGV